MVVGVHLQAIVEVAMVVVVVVVVVVVGVVMGEGAVGADLVSHAILNIEVYNLGEYFFCD